MGRSASWPRTAPTGAGGRKARACDGSSAGGRGGTVSLLPDCLAAHLSGTLPEVEATVRATEQAPTLAAAARQARLELPRTLEPARFGSVEPTLGAFGAVLGTVAMLVRLRKVAAARLDKLPAPVGFRTARRQPARAPPAKKQHETGLDPPRELIQGGASGTQPPPILGGTLSEPNSELAREVALFRFGVPIPVIVNTVPIDREQSERSGARPHYS